MKTDEGYYAELNHRWTPKGRHKLDPDKAKDVPNDLVVVLHHTKKQWYYLEYLTKRNGGPIDPEHGYLIAVQEDVDISLFTLPNVNRAELFKRILAL